jgi:hypothetical protein
MMLWNVDVVGCPSRLLFSQLFVAQEQNRIS